MRFCSSSFDGASACLIPRWNQTVKTKMKIFNCEYGVGGKKRFCTEESVAVWMHVVADGGIGCLDGFGTRKQTVSFDERGEWAVEVVAAPGLLYG